MPPMHHAMKSRNVSDTSGTQAERLIWLFLPSARVKLVAMTLIWAFLLVQSVTGQTRNTAPGDVGLSSEALSRIKPALQEFVDHEQVSGVITMIARKGKIVYTDAVGMRDID